MQTWLGLLPINIALTASCIAMVFIAIPVDVQHSSMMLNVSIVTSLLASPSGLMVLRLSMSCVMQYASILCPI